MLLADAFNKTEHPALAHVLNTLADEHLVLILDTQRAFTDPTFTNKKGDICGTKETEVISDNIERVSSLFRKSDIDILFQTYFSKERWNELCEDKEESIAVLEDPYEVDDYGDRIFSDEDISWAKKAITIIPERIDREKRTSHGGLHRVTHHPQDDWIIKGGDGGVSEGQLGEYLAEHNHKKTIWFFGFNTSGCVWETFSEIMRDIDQEYQICLIDSCVGSGFEKSLHDIAERNPSFKKEYDNVDKDAIKNMQAEGALYMDERQAFSILKYITQSAQQKNTPPLPSPKT